MSPVTVISRLAVTLILIHSVVEMCTYEQVAEVHKFYIANWMASQEDAGKLQALQGSQIYRVAQVACSLLGEERVTTRLIIGTRSIAEACSAVILERVPPEIGRARSLHLC